MSWRPSWWLDVLKLYWPLNYWSARATRHPLVGGLVTRLARPFFSQKNFQITYLPVNVRIPPTASTVLTQNVIAELIRRSAHRVIIKRCSCRDSKGCKNYPIEDSCLLLGEDTRVISPSIAHHVSVEEALQHLDEKIALGLIPMTGRVRLDDLYYGIPNRGKMLTICFCCPCCCTVLSSARYLPSEFSTAMIKLQGMRVLVDEEKCQRCGACVQACFKEAIRLQDGYIRHDEERCIGCGRCSTVCPAGATHLMVEDCDAAVDEILGRIQQRIDIT